MDYGRYRCKLGITVHVSHTKDRNQTESYDEANDSNPQEQHCNKVQIPGNNISMCQHYKKNTCFKKLAKQKSKP